MPPSSNLDALKQSSKRKLSSQDANQQPSKRHKALRDARNIRTQPAVAAYKNGELDVASFVQAREFEIRALEDSLRKGRNTQSSRAFQQVPREMRRRTASHNVDKVPKRLRRRAAREMAEDNTPTVNARSRRKEANPKMRLRLDMAKRLQRLTQKAKASKAKRALELLAISVVKDGQEPKESPKARTPATIKVRLPRIKKNTLQSPARPPAKFAKRQRNKTWLPTHLHHTKRAHMTPARNPLWRWAVPLSPTMKCYRATHRASTGRGAMAWDMSYLSTLGLEGRSSSIEGLLRAMGVGAGGAEAETWGKRGIKWRAGKRAWHGWLHGRQTWPRDAIAPATLIWRPENPSQQSELSQSYGEDSQPAPKKASAKPEKRKLFLRVHPSAFATVWEEVIRLAKVQKPAVTVEDLRYEVASLEIVGPQALEALVGAIHEYEEYSSDTNKKNKQQVQPSAWKQLAGCSNPASLPKAFVIPLEIADPRLRFPPRKIDSQRLTSEAMQQRLLHLATDWPWDHQGPPTRSIFDRLARLVASKLPTQKSIDRRTRAAPPGKSVQIQVTDPRIPVLVYSMPNGGNRSSRLTVLLPWKCTVPIWRSVMYYPLSTGGQVALGCLEQQRQLSFEAGLPWFPGDFPGTKAGDAWAAMEEDRQRTVWERTPKAKRVSFESLRLGQGPKGELGKGWCCDWDFLGHVHGMESPVHMPGTIAQSAFTRAADTADAVEQAGEEQQKSSIQDSLAANGVVAVRITLLSKGAPKTNARIYRLPSAPANMDLRSSWLTLQPSHIQRKSKDTRLPRISAPRLPPDAPVHIRNQHLAAALLNPDSKGVGQSTYPSTPDKTDLIGFVTSVNYNLAHGLGTAVGSLILSRVLSCNKGSGRVDERTLCIVRNAGEVTGRLARWELV